MRHHFEDDERGFGVSAPWWDVVFGTYSERARSSGSQSVQ
jgi:sterol desaturase/sphingolipid hydroxylase (fatty acid hydroxylase superfamily)